MLGREFKEKGLGWNPPSHWEKITTLDAHTAGEPLRFITGGLPDIPGENILEKRRWFRDNLDHLRTGLMWEPRGHADMYGAVLTDPVTPDGDFGVIFLHNEGYSTMCGHAVIALATICLDTGLVKKNGQNPVIRMDTPAGRVTATAVIEAGKVKEVSFINVPSFVYKTGQEITVPGLGIVKYDIAYGGAFYVFCNAEELNLRLRPQDYNQLIDWGRRIKYAVMSRQKIKHPYEDDLGFCYGTIFVADAHIASHHSRNVCVFAEGEVDRSPTGTGVSARAALHHFRGELKPGEWITIESILDTCFQVRVAETTRVGPYPAVLPEVKGSAVITGRHEFFFNPDDRLKKGFLFR